jgi:sarcosine oxidase, subunit gamma
VSELPASVGAFSAVLAALAAEDLHRAVDERVGVVLSPLSGLAVLNLRAAPGTTSLAEAVQRGPGLPLPDAVFGSAADATGRARALWIGPGDWLIVCGEAERALVATQLMAALDGQSGALTDVGHGWAGINLRGRAATAVLASGCGLDLDPRVFRPGHCAMTGFGKLRVVIERRPDSTCGADGEAPGQSYDVLVARSFAASLWHMLLDAAHEHGYRVTPPAAGSPG